MTKDQLEQLAERAKLPVDVLKLALRAVYGLNHCYIPLPPGMKATGFHKVGPGETFLSAGTLTEHTARATDILLHDEPRIILEPNVLEVEVVSFEPVVEGGKHAYRKLRDGSEYGLNVGSGSFYQGPTHTHESPVYRKVVTKKSIPIT